MKTKNHFSKYLYFKIKVQIFFDDEIKQWCFLDRKYKIVSFGKTTRIANKKFQIELNKRLNEK